MTEWLGHTEIPMPTGVALVQTSRPAPDADWTTSVDAPGLDLHDWWFTTDSGALAKDVHRSTCDAVQEAIDEIPDIHLGAGDLDTYDPDDREPMGGDPWWRDPAER